MVYKNTSYFLRSGSDSSFLREGFVSDSIQTLKTLGKKKNNKLQFTSSIVEIAFCIKLLEIELLGFHVSIF